MMPWYAPRVTGRQRTLRKPFCRWIPYPACILEISGSDGNHLGFHYFPLWWTRPCIGPQVNAIHPILFVFSLRRPDAIYRNKQCGNHSGKTQQKFLYRRPAVYCFWYTRLYEAIALSSGSILIDVAPSGRITL